MPENTLFLCPALKFNFSLTLEMYRNTIHWSRAVSGMSKHKHIRRWWITAAGEERGKFIQQELAHSCYRGYCQVLQTDTEQILVYTRKTARKIKAASDLLWSKPMASGSPCIPRLIYRFFLLQFFSLQRSSIHSKVAVKIALEACCKNGEKMTRTEIFWKVILYLQNITEHAMQSNQGKASWCCGTLLREVGYEGICQRALPKSSPSVCTLRSKGLT